ncbi:MAG: DegT/DnrJ/EryC1/StrS family aminotransferase [bacterium]
MRVPLLNMKAEYADLRDQVNAAIAEVFERTNFINGSQVTDLEERIAGYCSVRHAVGVASGTDALLLALRAVGTQPGDEVITAPFTFFATAGAIVNVGAKPVFVDIEPRTFNIDAAKLEAAITERTRAIMPVHLFGQCADMDAINKVAARHKLAVIEDAAQAISARYKGKYAGTLGTIGCFSFYPTKNLGAAGDGGMVVTDDDELDALLRKLKKHGGSDEYYHDLVGYNSRLDTLQAALLLVKLPHLNGWSEARRANAAYYDQRFAGAALETPLVADYAYHIYNQYTIQVDRRDELQSFLKQKEIGHKVYYPLPLHLQHCFADLGYKEGDFPQAERCAKRVLSLPIHAQLTEPERECVADAVLEFVSG